MVTTKKGCVNETCAWNAWKERNDDEHEELSCDEEKEEDEEH